MCKIAIRSIWFIIVAFACIINQSANKKAEIAINNPSEIQCRRVKTYFTGTRIKINNSSVQESF